METPPNRKGARSMKDISPALLAQLNQGLLPSANLVEWLAIDQPTMLQNFLEVSQRTHYWEAINLSLQQLKKRTVNTVMEAIGQGLLRQSLQRQDSQLLALMQGHPADMVRCWATFLIGKNEQLNLAEKLAKIEIFAADTHFGVREVAWMALRPSLAVHLQESIDLLSVWAMHQDENLRRFASEATRPRGVWCAHIEALKQHPEQALPILSPLKSDTSRYVQNSVGNWLNDAAKTQPNFVKNLCTEWATKSPTKATAYIIKRAMRSLKA